MARIAGVNLPDNKHIVIALTGVFGIGPNTSMKICNETKIEPSRKLKDLSEEELILFVQLFLIICGRRPKKRNFSKY